MVEVPSSIVSPGLSDCGPGDAAPVDLDAVGGAEVLDDPLAAARAHLGVAARDVLVGEHDVAVARAADHAAAGAQHGGLALVAQPRRAAPVVGLAQRLREPLGGRVDHRVALVALARRRRESSSAGRTSRAWMPNSPSRSRSSVLKRDLRRGDERDPLAARVLEQVARELGGEVALVALELLAVVGREPDGVLVGGVGARQRLDLVLLHLARELARDLHRAHLGLEGTRERALDKTGQLGLQVAQNAHRGAFTISRGSRRGSSQASAPAAIAPATRPARRRGARPLGQRGGARRRAPAAQAEAATKSTPGVAPAHEPRQHQRRERPQGGERDQPGGQRRPQHAVERAARRRPPSRAAARRRTSSVASSSGSASSSHHSPAAPRPGALPPAPGAARERRVGARERRPGRAAARPRAATRRGPEPRTSAAAAAARRQQHERRARPVGREQDRERGRARQPADARQRGDGDRGRSRRGERGDRRRRARAWRRPRRARRRRARPAIRPATGGSCGGARALERVGEDRAALVGDVGQARGELVGELVERAAVLRPRRQRAVQRGAQLRPAGPCACARAAGAPCRACARSRPGCRRAPGSRPRAPRRARARASRGRRARRRGGRRPAPAPCRRACRRRRRCASAARRRPGARRRSRSASPPSARSAGGRGRSRSAA